MSSARLWPPPASQVHEEQPVLEIAIRGNSMAPAIAAGARLRIRPAGPGPCEAGDVVFFLADGGYTVHRVVDRARRRSGVEYLLTCGDARLAPDAPVPRSQILGTVIAVQSGGDWHPVGTPTACSLTRRAIRAFTRVATIGALHFSAAAAARLAAVFLVLESGARVARRRFLGLLFRTRFETALALSPVGRLLDRACRGVEHWKLDVPRINRLFPVARRTEVARALAESLAESDRLCYFRNLSWYNWRHRHLPRGIPALDDLYPPNLAVLDFLAHRLASPEREVLLDFPCGIGVLLVYEQALGLPHVHGFDNWRDLARSTAERFLQRFGLNGSVLLTADDLASLPVTILTCVGFPLPLLLETSDVWAKPSVRYVLADRMGRPATLPGFRRAAEYGALLTVFERSA